MKTNADNIIKPSCNELLTKVQNPYFYPVFDPRYPFELGAEITIGDLHANLMALINLCIYHGIFKLKKEDYNQLRKILFLKPKALSKDILTNFLETLNKAEIFLEYSKGTLRLLGDELADRFFGCDGLFLFFLRFLSQRGINYTIILSNHAYELIYHFEMGTRFENHFITAEKKDGVNNSFIYSMVVLQEIIDRGIISRAEVDNLLTLYYFPHLTCVDYSVSKDNKLTWYTHSYAPAKVICHLADKLWVNHPQDIFTDKKHLQIAVLKGIQEKFKAVVESKKIHEYIKINKSKTYDKTWSPLGWIIWTRALEQPQQASDLGILHVNGHHNLENTPSNYIVLNTKYGFFNKPFNKIDEQFEMNTFYYTHESKNLNYWHFKEPFEALKQNIPVVHFTQEELRTILDENNLCSSYHLDCLKFFIFDGEKTKKIWATIASINLPSDIPRSAVINNLYTREIIYLLHKMQADTAENIKLTLMNSFEDHQCLFSSLLLLDYYNSDLITKLLAIPSSLKIKIYLQLCILKEKFVTSIVEVTKLLAALEPEANFNIANEIKNYVPFALDSKAFELPCLAELKLLKTLNIPIREECIKELLLKQLDPCFTNQSAFFTKFSAKHLASFFSLYVYIKEKQNLDYLLTDSNFLNGVAIWDAALMDDYNNLSSVQILYMFNPVNFKSVVLWLNFLEEITSKTSRNLYIGNFLRVKNVLSKQLMDCIKNKPEEVLKLLFEMIKTKMLSSENINKIFILTENCTKPIDFDAIKSHIINTENVNNVKIL